MKIAILSMQKVLNYGSLLQAMSLKQMIEEESGSPVEFIDIVENPSVAVNMPVHDNKDYEVPYYRKMGLLEKIKKFFMYQVQKRVVYPRFEEYMKNALGCAEDNSKKQYDIVFVGSDEVFKATDRIRLQLYGSIGQGKKIVSYAASCGSAVVSGIPESSMGVVKDAIRNFSYMSVRDSGTQEYVRNLYDGEIEIHLDPVLMGSLYKREHKQVPLSKYMIVYAYNNRIRTKEEVETIIRFAKDYNLKLVCFGGVLQWCDLYIPAKPERVLDYFYYADFVVTDTFHGTIFSILNHKKFVSLIRATNKNKLGDLLKRLNLSNRVVTDMSAFQETLLAEIDYEITDSILNKERVNTRNYIRKCLALAKE